MLTSNQGIPDFCRISVDLLVVIVNRGRGQRLIQAFSERGITFNLFCLGRGAADQKILSYLGLGETEKEIIFSTMPSELAHRILHKLHFEAGLNKPGAGIAFCTPISGIGDSVSCQLLEDSELEEEEIRMEHTHLYDLILAITNQSYADEVMDAAKAAGASGGTIVHARGAGVKEAEKFFGITIQPEKEMILILTHKEKSRTIMNAMVEKSELQAEARTIALSLAVTGTAGLSETTY